MIPIAVRQRQATPPITPPAIAPTWSPAEYEVTGTVVATAVDVVAAAVEVVAAAVEIVAADVEVVAATVEVAARAVEVAAAAEEAVMNAEAFASSSLRLAAVRSFVGHPLEQGLLLQQPMKAGFVPVQVYQLLSAAHAWSGKVL